MLAFIPKAIFLDRLENDPGSISTFLLLSILAVSARFTPSLVKRYGDRAKATKSFVDRAESLVTGAMYKTRLDNVQAFILLGVAEWANGDRSRSLVSLSWHPLWSFLTQNPTDSFGHCNNK